MGKVTGRIVDELHPTDPIYAVLDGARDRSMRRWLLTSQAPSWCLYAGKLTPQLEDAAPWLVRLLRGHKYTEDFFQRGWGGARGILLSSTAPAREVRRQLRRHLLVKSPEGKRMLFRYYDPRVLRAFLPACTPAELRSFFGPIQSMGAESPDGASLLVYRAPAAG